jgi:hypothetical protein
MRRAERSLKQGVAGSRTSCSFGGPAGVLKRKVMLAPDARSSGQDADLGPGEVNAKIGKHASKKEGTRSACESSDFSQCSSKDVLVIDVQD